MSTQTLVGDDRQEHEEVVDDPGAEAAAWLARARAEAAAWVAEAGAAAHAWAVRAREEAEEMVADWRAEIRMEEL
jgi:hypothetical protein